MTRPVDATPRPGRYVVSHRPMDRTARREAALAGEEPGQVLLDLADRWGAAMLAPAGQPVAAVDRLLGKLIGDAAAWAFARRMVRSLTAADQVFCNSEAVGFPIAAVLSRRRDRPRLAVFVHNTNRPRARAVMRLFALRRTIDVFLVCSRAQEAFLRRHLRLPSERVVFVDDTTDTTFFTPGPPSADKQRPLVMAVGLEQRDYGSLAAAVDGLDVDVKVSAFSTDAKAVARTLPDPLPRNMERRFYPWPELVQLYRDADVVVVSLYENDYAAGVQALMEGQSCRRPVVVTATSGLAGYLDDDAVVSVPVGDPAALRRALEDLLAHPGRAQALADRGSARATRYSGDRYITALISAIGGPAA